MKISNIILISIYNEKYDNNYGFLISQISVIFYLIFNIANLIN